nr:sperm activating peptide III [Astriclypeus mannii]
TDSAHLIG